jgi:hypothetical protein
MTTTEPVEIPQLGVGEATDDTDPDRRPHVAPRLHDDVRLRPAASHERQRLEQDGDVPVAVTAGAHHERPVRRALRHGPVEVRVDPEGEHRDPGSRGQATGQLVRLRLRQAPEKVHAAEQVLGHPRLQPPVGAALPHVGTPDDAAAECREAAAPP